MTQNKPLDLEPILDLEPTHDVIPFEELKEVKFGSEVKPKDPVDERSLLSKGWHLLTDEPEIVKSGINKIANPLKAPALNNNLPIPRPENSNARALSLAGFGDPGIMGINDPAKLVAQLKSFLGGSLQGAGSLLTPANLLTLGRGKLAGAVAKGVGAGQVVSGGGKLLNGQYGSGAADIGFGLLGLLGGREVGNEEPIPSNTKIPKLTAAEKPKYRLNLDGSYTELPNEGPKLQQAPDSAGAILKTPKYSPEDESFILKNGITKDRNGNPVDPKSFDNPIARVILKLREARPLNKQQREMYSIERNKRIGELKNAPGEGDEYIGNIKKALSGEYEKVRFEPVEFEPEEWDKLVGMIRDYPFKDSFKIISGTSALEKISRGVVPQPAEIRTLSEVFTHRLTRDLKDPQAASLLGNELVDSLVTKNPKFSRYTSEGMDLQKSLMSSIDMSAPLRQGLPLIHRKEYWNSLGTMAKSWGDKNFYESSLNSIKSDPVFDLSQKYGLAVEDVADIAKKNPQFASRFSQMIPGVAASERAYSGFLSKLRFDTFKSMLNDARKMGVDDDEAGYYISKFINTATGSGDLAKFGLEKHADALNKVFYSPKLMASRAEMLNPLFYIKQPKYVRTQAIKSGLAAASFTATASALGYLGGGSVVADPRSSDFGKVKFGNTRIDPGAGFLQYLVNGYRIINKETMNNKGEVKLFDGKFNSPSVKEVVQKFLENKLSPTFALGNKAMEGYDPKGREYNMPAEMAKTYIPMFLQDVYDVMQQDPDAAGLLDNLNGLGMPEDKGALAAVPASFFGMGSQTYR